MAATEKRQEKGGSITSRNRKINSLRYLLHQKREQGGQLIKLILLGKKDPDKTMEEFKKYYLERHAPLVKKTVPHIKRYVINFALERPGKSNPVDFITELWWDDIDSVRKFYKSDDYKNIIRPDEIKLGATGDGAYFEEFVQK